MHCTGVESVSGRGSVNLAFVGSGGAVGVASEQAQDVQSPYVVGRWVRGAEHYDRQGLIEYLLAAPDTAIWVVGTRRMGKTSLLRQIELVTAQERAHLVPLFWDLQGCTDPATLTLELLQAIEDAVARAATRGAGQ